MRVTVNYFDLGLCKGNEIAMFLEDMATFDVDLCVHGIEANPATAKKCRDRFADDDRVTIHNFAIGSVEANNAVLFKSPDAWGAGSSLYGDKGNVSREDYVTVQSYPFAEWLLRLPSIDRFDCINVIKANIEGSERDLIRDLDRHDMFHYFDMFWGPQAKHGWTCDMRKIPSLRSHVYPTEEILKRRGVNVVRYHDASSRGHMSSAVRKEMGRLIKERSSQ